MTGRANTFVAPLRSLRLCVRLYWRSVLTGHEREFATPGGCPSPMLRMVPLLLRNAYGSPILGRICNHHPSPQRRLGPIARVDLARHT